MDLTHESEIKKVNNQKRDDPLTGRIKGAAIEMHRRLGPGLLELTYENSVVINAITPFIW